MIWTVNNSTNWAPTGTGGVSSHALGFTPVDGSKLLIFLNIDSTASPAPAITAVDDGTNSFGAVFQLSAAIGSGTNLLQCWALDHPHYGSAPTINIHQTSGGTAANFTQPVVVVEVSGLTTGTSSSILDGSVGSSSWSASTTATDPTYSSTAVNEFLIQLVGDAFDGFTLTAPTGYTSSVVHNSGTDGSEGVAWKNSTGGSEAGAEWTWSGTGAGMGAKVAFKLAGSAVSATATGQTPLTLGVQPVGVTIQTESAAAQTAITPALGVTATAAATTVQSATATGQTAITPGRGVTTTAAAQVTAAATGQTAVAPARGVTATAAAVQSASATGQTAVTPALGVTAQGVTVQSATATGQTAVTPGVGVMAGGSTGQFAAATGQTPLTLGVQPVGVTIQSVVAAAQTAATPAVGVTATATTSGGPSATAAAQTAVTPAVPSAATVGAMQVASVAALTPVLVAIPSTATASLGGVSAIANGQTAVTCTVLTAGQAAAIAYAAATGQTAITSHIPVSARAEIGSPVSFGTVTLVESAVTTATLS